MATDQHDIPASVSSLAARVESWARDLPEEESAVLRQILLAAAGGDADEVAGFSFGTLFGPLILGAYVRATSDAPSSNVQKTDHARNQAATDNLR